MITNLPAYAEARPRNRHLKIDDDGLGLSLELPPPRDLAKEWAAPTIMDTGRWSRTSGTVLLDGTPTDLETLRDAVLAAIAAIVEIPDTRPCRDLVRAPAFTRSPGVADYWHDLTRATRTHLREPAKPPRSREPGKSSAERSRAKAEHDREAEIASAWWCLSSWATDHEPGQVAAVDLYREALAPLPEIIATYVDEIEATYRTGASRTAALAAWVEESAEAEGWPPYPRRPGPRRFRAAASEIFGPPRRSHGVDYYMITAEAIASIALDE